MGMGSPSSALGRMTLTAAPISPHTPTMSVDLEGGELVARNERPRAHPGERMCIEPACTTKLSRYNSSTTCFLHGEEQRRASFLHISAAARLRWGNSRSPGLERNSIVEAEGPGTGTSTTWGPAVR
jgi:hypothetical protein